MAEGIIGTNDALEDRKRSIIRTSVLGIVANVALSAFKAAVGLISNSIAITLDAVNNLSDAASSAITIVGTNLASKPADHDHPYGHGRYEYLTTMVVAALVLWAGLTALMQAADAIIHPGVPDYSPRGLIIVAAAVVVKLALGAYFKRQGKRLGSGSLVASGEDASFDAVISATTLVAAGIYIVFGVSLEAWLGIAISVVIIKSGIEMLREALDKVLGVRIEAQLAHDIIDTVCSVEGVRGAFDLILNDYGPNRLSGSVHIEVDEHMSARDIDRITRQIQVAVFTSQNVILHTVGVYSTNTDAASVVSDIRSVIERAIEANPYLLQAHGLYVDDANSVTFDLVVSFDAPDRDHERDKVVRQLERLFPTYTFSATVDSDISG